MTKRSRNDAARVRFILKDRSERETLIYLTVRVDKSRVKWSTGEKINPKDWSTKTRRSIVRFRSLENQQLNERLDHYAREAMALYNDWQLDTPSGLQGFSVDGFKQELEYRLGRKARPEAKTTAKLDTSDFIRFAESVRDQRKGSTEVVHRTWQKLNNHVNLLREFADLWHGGTVAFTEVDDLFIDNLKRWLFRSKGHSRQTVHKVMITLRSIASRAADRGLMTYGKQFRKWAKQEFRKLPQPALTREELDTIINLDLTSKPRLERVRDLFLIGVATAQRWSDYSTLTRKNFHALPGGGYRYHIASQRKTASGAGGPVMGWALPTLRKYGYIGSKRFDNPKISPQKFNDYIKEVVKISLPDATATVYLDGENIDHTGTEVPKWSVVGSHTARRTAVSLLRSMNAPDEQIMKMTGHRNIAELTTYDVRDAEAIAMEMGRDLDAAWSRSKLKAI
ncbi:phage integrase SAM-like domain-containing protein [Lewinella sp. JB7]|uniref:phage integrase SAM-like domain-containing protein n=1 Tax=Lewinella sp. JB7 TaxID=2962887 RepID=UPI0020CA0AE7|nr:phage integrase SAM-like domain-containing protein [Lewinella sp. JB7]MCP9237079.1 site-specific integrase [Lewinella sp. JB7]